VPPAWTLFFKVSFNLLLDYARRHHLTDDDDDSEIYYLNLYSRLPISKASKATKVKAWDITKPIRSETPLQSFTMRCRSNLLLLGLAPSCTARRMPKKLSSKRSSTTGLKNVLSVRGGAGPLNTEITAKIATALVSLDCAVAVLAPEQSKKMLGLPTSPCLDLRCRYIHFSSAAHALAASCILFGGASVNTALAVSLICCIVPHLKAIIASKPKEFGFSASGQYLAAVVNIALASTLLSNASFATSLIKYASLWAALNGLGLIFAPVAMDKLWGFPTADDPLGAFFNKFLGYTVLGYSIFCLSLTSGLGIQKSIGYSSIPSLTSLILQNFVTKEVENYNMQKVPQLFAIAVTGIIVATLAF
jgi:energy-converting hydrogenase Eha subunit A